MLLETSATYILQDMVESNEILLEAGNKHDYRAIVATTERLLYNKAIPQGEAQYWLQGIDLTTLNEVDGYATIFLIDDFEHEYGAQYKYALLGLLLESGVHTSDSLNNMSLSEFKQILMLLYTMPQDAIDAVFQFHTYQRNKQTSSLYNNITSFVDEQYRISDHWNVWQKLQNQQGKTYNKCFAPTTDGKLITKNFCLGEKVGKKWQLIEEFGAPIRRNASQRTAIAQQILDSQLFANNHAVLDYLAILLK